VFRKEKIRDGATLVATISVGQIGQQMRLYHKPAHLMEQASFLGPQYLVQEIKRYISAHENGCSTAD
jgi:hypothetical protein